MLKRIFLAVSFACTVMNASVSAGGGAPAELEKMRKAFGAAVSKRDVKATAAITQFPLAFSGYEHPEKVMAAEFADEFDDLFFGGDPHSATCLATSKLKRAQSRFPNSPWVIDCDGNEYYFGQRNGKWKFTAYKNVNE